MSTPHHHESCFSIFLYNLSQTPRRLRERAGATCSSDEELTEIRQRSGADMKRKLEWYDLVALGIGGMLGSGVFVTTGTVALNVSGPSIFISYMVAGIAALLSSLCYTEFSVEMPVAGGAFSYLRITFGEFVGYFGGANLLMEYVLSNAVVARSFTEYLCSTIGVTDPNAWRIEVAFLPNGYNMLDFTAVGLIVLLTICLCYSTKESSLLNLVMTVFHVAFVGFVTIVGFSNGSVKNLVKPKGLAPYGIKGVFDGAAIVYISYIGYDSVSTMAEEIRNPSKSLPVGIAGSVAIVSILYCLMTLALSTMVPYNEIIATAPFSSAFKRIVGWQWAGNVVGAGASLGIITSLLVAMLGQARYMCVVGRAHLVPLWFARVNQSTGTPVNSTLSLGMCTAFIALFAGLDQIIEMISIGALLVFYMVANALIYRRYVRPGFSRPLPTLLFLVILSAISCGFAIQWKLERGWWELGMFGLAYISMIAIFQGLVTPVYRPAKWRVPLMPWPASASIFLNVFLLGTLRRRSYQRFGIWSLVVCLFYLLYSVHSTYNAEDQKTNADGGSASLASNGEQNKVEIQME
ncbi:hypothetical protein AMTRI_Chr03g52270 [Amborella trichopoda]